MTQHFGSVSKQRPLFIQPHSLFDARKTWLLCRIFVASRSGPQFDLARWPGLWQLWRPGTVTGKVAGVQPQSHSHQNERFALADSACAISTGTETVCSWTNSPALREKFTTTCKSWVSSGREVTLTSMSRSGPQTRHLENPRRSGLTSTHGFSPSGLCQAAFCKPQTQLEDSKNLLLLSAAGLLGENPQQYLWECLPRVRSQRILDFAKRERAYFAQSCRL